MRSLVLGLLAVLVLVVPSVAAQRNPQRSTSVDPRTYASASGEYALFVDPSSPNGSGAATYRLSRKGVELWTTTLPFTWTIALVCDDGTSAGYGYSLGLETRYDELGSLEVAVLDAKGAVRQRDSTPRVPSSFLHVDADPSAVGLLSFADLDRFVVRISNEDVNRQSEAWWTYRISTAERSATFRPKDGQANAGSIRGVLGAVRVRETPLALVHWHQYGEYEPSRRTPMGSRFALVDETGASVWSLDLPDEYAKVDEEEQLARLTAVREREHGAIARWDEARRFELDLVEGAQRVAFEVTGGGSQPWVVREIGRRAIGDVEHAQAAEPSVDASLPPPTPLELVGVVDLETCKSPAPFVRTVHAFAFDGAGNVAFLHWEHDPDRVELGYADARGARIANHVLLEFNDARGHYVSDLAWLGDERFLVGWESYSTNPPGKAKVLAVSARTGDHALLADDFGSKLNGLASSGDGRFVVLGDNRLDAFDAGGKRSWMLTSEDGLCGAEHIAVLSDERIVVADRSGLQWIRWSGKVGRYDAFEELWGREPGYVNGLEAGLGGGLVVEDSDRNVCMDASGKSIGEIAPRFRTGNLARFDELRAGPGGRLWTTDRCSIVALDAQGVVEIVLGEAPDVARLTEAAAVALDREDRIHAVSERTGDVHVIDVEKGLVRVLRPAPATIAESINFANTSLSIDDEFGIHLEADDVFVDWDRDGKIVGTRRARDGVPLSVAQPSTKNRFVRGKMALELEDATGKVLAVFDRKPDGQWLKATRPHLAPDGSMAFLAQRTVETKENPSEAVIYAADGTPRAQIPLITSGAYVPTFAYDGVRIVLLANGRLHVHDVAGGAVSTHPLPDIGDAKTDYWTCFLPRGRDEVWVFDARRTLRRYALPRR